MSVVSYPNYGRQEKMVEKNKQETNSQDALSKRLDIVIMLLLDRQRTQDKKITKADQIHMLYSSGLKSAEIGKLIGWPDSAVRTEISKMRRGKKK